MNELVISNRRDSLEVVLPSKGKYYNRPDWDGKVKLLALTIAEQDILSTDYLIASGAALPQIYRNCVMLPEGMDVLDLHMQDMWVLLYYLHHISFRTPISFDTMCPHCHSIIKREINPESDDLQVTSLTVDKPYPFVLDKNYFGFKEDRNFTIKLQSWRDALEIEEALRKEQDAAKRDKRETKRREFSERLKHMVVAIEGIDAVLKDTFIEHLNANDAKILNTLITNPNFGVGDIIDCKCTNKNCGKTFKALIDLTVDSFFRVTVPDLF